MTLTALLAVATIAIGAGGATLAARYSRNVNDRVRALARRGTQVNHISRRTRLPQDVVTMMLAGMVAPAAGPRQKAPVAAVYSAPAMRSVHRTGKTRSRNPLSINGLRGHARGMDVA